MSALQIFRPARGGGSNRQYCQGSGPVHPHRRTGIYVAEIMGYPAGNLCEACKREWEEAWNYPSGEDRRAA